MANRRDLRAAMAKSPASGSDMKAFDAAEALPPSRSQGPSVAVVTSPLERSWDANERDGDASSPSLGQRRVASDPVEGRPSPSERQFRMVLALGRFGTHLVLIGTLLGRNETRMGFADRV